MRRNIIGTRIKAARKANSPPVTQAELAARLQVAGLNLDRIAISKIETGIREINDLEIKSIAAALNIRVGWLFGEND